MMRISIILVCLFLGITSCDNSKKDKNSNSLNNQNKSIEAQEEQNTSDQDSSASNLMNTDSQDGKMDSEDNSKKENKNLNNTIAGLYINNDHLEDNNCNCYCIEVKLSDTAELCLTKDKLYINGRFETSGNNINIYYTGKSSGNTDTNIPWDKFETGTPIAVLTPDDNGFKLDWKGFSIDGKIAIDYALYGKKTLEGTYKKK